MRGGGNSGRWINQGSLTAGQWLRLLKLFELELSVRKIVLQLRLSCNAACNAVHTIRAAILANSIDGNVSLRGEVEVDESYSGGKRKGKRGRGAAGKVPVFGILEREGRVFVEVLPTTRANDVLALTVMKVRRGSIVYTDRYKSYDALMFCGYRHLRVDHGKYFSRGRVHINGLEIRSAYDSDNYALPVGPTAGGWVTSPFLGRSYLLIRPFFSGW